MFRESLVATVLEWELFFIMGVSGRKECLSVIERYLSVIERYLSVIERYLSVIERYLSVIESSLYFKGSWNLF